MAMAAEDGCESSAAGSSSNSAVNWWATSMQEVHGSPLCSWPSHCDVQLPWRAAGGTAAGSRRRRAADPACCNGEEEEEMLSTTNSFSARYRSSLGVESQDVMPQSGSHVHLSLEPTTPPGAHVWNQVFHGVGSNGELPHNQVDGDKLLAAFTSKTLRTEIFEPPPDHFSKPETNWEFTNYSGGFDHEKLNFLVNNWSIAPLDSQAAQNLTDESASSCTTLNSALNLYQEGNLSQFDLRPEFKLDNPSSSSYSDGGSGAGNTMNPVSFSPCFRNYSKEGKQIEASNAPFGASNCGTYGDDQLSLSGSNAADRPWRSTRSAADVIYFGSGTLNKPLLDFQASKMHMKGPELQSCKKSSHETSLSSRDNVRGEAGSSDETNKKKKMEDDSHTVQKKQKQEGSSVLSSKLQVPKVKLGDRITALQQIVAPFGKTDTASVLLEAITYIKFMQEQVVLLLNHPYMKPTPSTQRDHNLWGGVESRAEAKMDLRSRGLCLVPISFTPQVCRESTGVDYWTPTYRGCLYR
ncbi:transcription factor bHLH112-like isoform X1 [Nymphaea colorata]|nr:transcription factor bHLH112-like isoform X1 [Nymphaea colorata]